jgi:hypothetical protein
MERPPRPSPAPQRRNPKRNSAVSSAEQARSRRVVRSGETKVAITIEVVFSDGTRRRVRDYDSFDEAIDDAFTLADTHGEDPGDGSGPPDRVQVRVDDRIELSIRVLRGGLLRSTAGRG